jgi:hypothetical protein
MERKRLVLDANILIRGCFGRRVRLILANHADQADFFWLRRLSRRPVAMSSTSPAGGVSMMLFARKLSRVC